MNIAEEFKKNRYVYIPNMVDKDACEQLTKHMFKLKDEGKLHRDEQCPRSLSVYGDPLFDAVLRTLAGALSEKLNIDLLPTYTYARIYSPGEVLKRHTDRESCEISGTLTLAFDPESEIWPISYTKDKTDPVGNSVKIEVGDIFVYRGNEVDHWRDEYKGKWQVQIFFHFVDAKGPHANWENDKRHLQNSVLNDGSCPCLATFNSEFRPDLAFTKEECKKIISFADYRKPEKAIIGDSVVDESIRRANVYEINLSQDTSWIFEKLLKAINEANDNFFGFEIQGMIHGLQLIHYKSSNNGFYDWHTDMGPGTSATRKISAVTMLSESTDYENGDLIMDNYGIQVKASREIGSIHLFPSYLRHTVTPVTAGDRWVLVNWIHGNKRFS